MKIRKWSLFFLLGLLVISYSCKKKNVEPVVSKKDIIESFRSETGINAICVIDTGLLNIVVSWQGHGDYPGVDDWATAIVPDNFDLLGGLPGQSLFYSINQTIVDADTMKVVCWESLQVKENT